MTLQEVRAVKEEIKRLSMMADDAEKRLLEEIEERKKWRYQLDEPRDWGNYDFTGIRAIGTLKHSILVAKHMLTHIASPRNK